MFVSDFDYILPPSLIAQTPVEPRDTSRLMVLDRASRQISDRYFYELPEILEAGDLLVFNDSRVIPARLHAVKEGQANPAKVEVFLLKQLNSSDWECLVKPGKRVKPGVSLLFEGGVRGEVISATESGGRIIRFPQLVDFSAWLHQYGETPLPPYITQQVADPERYQTIYSRVEGSVAAPTAGLHFTPELFEQLTARGVSFGYLTLHVGLGTFRPVQSEQVEEHLMHPECFTLPQALVEQVAENKRLGRRVISVGTTVARVLESQGDDSGNLKAGTGETAIFIYPGYRFKVIDALITNFHLPRSTLLMLVSAFAGRDFVLESYNYAVKQGYRFFSFGDATFIK